MGFLEAELPEMVGADVLDVAGARIEAQAAHTADVRNTQRPLHVEDIGVRVGHRHHHLRQTGATCDSRHFGSPCYSDRPDPATAADLPTMRSQPSHCCYAV